MNRERLPGSWLRRFAERHLDRSAVEMVVLPVIADLQHEYTAAPRNSVTRGLVHFRGAWAFWRAIGFHTIISGDAKMRIAKHVGFDLAAFVIVLIAAFAFLRPGYVLNPNATRPMLYWSLLLVGCLVVLAIALAARARITAYCIAGVFAFMASEMAVQTYYWVVLRRSLGPGLTLGAVMNSRLVGRGFPIRVYRGFYGAAPDHFAVMGAALLGVALGAVLAIWGPKLAGRIRRAPTGGQGSGALS